MQLTKHWAATLDDYVIDLAWSPNGELLAAASASGPVSLFAATDGTLRHQLPGHDDGTNCLAWGPAPASPVEASGQKSDIRDPKSENSPNLAEGSSASSGPSSLTSELSPLTSAPSPLTSGSLLATGGQDGAVKFWDTAAGQHTATASLGTAWVEHLGWRRAGVSPASGSQAGGTPALLLAAAGKDLVALSADGAIKHRFKPAPKTISALAWQPAGGCVAVAYFGGVCLWDADDFVAQKEFGYANGIQALVWSPDSRWLVSGNQDPSVHLWIPAEDIELQMSGYEGKVKELSYDHTSRWLATGGGSECCVWDCSGAGPEGREPTMLPHEAKVCAVAFQHTHGLLATASQDGVVQLWSPERKQPLRATVRMPAAATKLVWSPDDALLAIGTAKGAVYVLKCEG